MQGLMVLYLVSFVLGILIVARVWRANTLDGVLTLFLPFYVFYALYKYWGDADHDIRWPLLAQIIVSAILLWNVYHIAPTLIDPHLAAVQSQGAEDGDQADEDNSATRPVRSSAAAQGKTLPGSATMQGKVPAQASEAEPPPRPATAAELNDLAAHVLFLRGRFVREAIGMRLDIPRGQHLLAGTDARNTDTALRGEVDAHLIGWMIAVDRTITDPNLRIVRLRWRHDGLVAGDAADPAALLDIAHAHSPAPRLAGSGGTLVRYDVAPEREGSTIIWSEERQPEGAATSAHDCHALRLARKGVLEFSIVGVDANAATACTTELRALVATVRFDPESDYPAQIQGEHLAPYSLSGMVTQTQ
ncbi:hypothetical protein [Rudaea sp.]|uniref:hypothetical protein n=1 Tax=Rudaea sp. TaxID=2136325 RepID=UPI002ED33E66